MRAALLAVLLSAGLAAITPYNDYYLRATFIGGNFMPVGAMIVLVALAWAVNPVLRWLAPKRAFTRAEMGVIWSVLLVTTCIPAAGLWRYIIPQMMGGRYLATPANRWGEVLVDKVPRWMAPQRWESARYFYESLPAGEPIPWDDWLLPLGFWLATTLTLFFCISCLLSIFRWQWSEAERFTFPLLQAPLEIMQEPAPGRLWNDFFRNHVVWCGVLIPFIAHGLNGLAVFYPWVPHPNLHIRTDAFFSEPPWTAIRGDTQIHLYPSIVGFTYLISTEVATGFWFAFLFDRVQRVLFQQLRWFSNLGGGGVMVQREAWGATIALVLTALWLARPHLRRVCRAAIGRERLETVEALPAPLAVWGLLAGWGVLIAVVTLSGAPWWMAAAIVLVACAMYLAITWAATNGGLLFVQLRFFPVDPLLDAFGSRAFTAKQAIVSTLFEQAWARDLRENIMPSLMHGQKVCQEVACGRRALFGVTAVSVVVSAMVAAVAWVVLAYTHGASRLGTGTFYYHAQTPYARAMEWVAVGVEPKPSGLGGVLFGAGLFVVMQSLRLRFFWWPIHPIGLTVMRSWCLRHFWFPIMLGCLFKVPIIRYGGMDAYRKARPFFLGLILGDMLMAAIFLVVGFITRQGYSVLPL